MSSKEPPAYVDWAPTDVMREVFGDEVTEKEAWNFAQPTPTRPMPKQLPAATPQTPLVEQRQSECIRRGDVLILAGLLAALVVVGIIGIVVYNKN